VGEPRRFCVRCGHELKQESRFCAACGHALPGTGQQRAGPAGGEEVAGPGYELTSTMSGPSGDDLVGPRPPAEPAWPSKGSYDPVGVSPQPGWPSRSPASAAVDPPSGAVDPAPDAVDRPPAATDRSAAAQPRSRWPLALGLVVLVAAGTVAVILLLLRPSHIAQVSAGATQANARGHKTARATPALPSASSSPAATSSQPPEQRAASSLATLLAQSVTDRSSIQTAVSDVNQCGPTLSQDPRTFEKAATSRQQLLSHLAGLPGRSALPASMLQALTGAWQASEAADQDLGQWAHDEVSRGCTQNDQSDANFQAATDPDDQATADKMAFVSQWDSVAAQYGLTTYQWNQL
jgi:zinc-ribbon domain